MRWSAPVGADHLVGDSNLTALAPKLFAIASSVSRADLWILDWSWFIRRTDIFSTSARLLDEPVFILLAKAATEKSV